MNEVFTLPFNSYIGSPTTALFLVSFSFLSYPTAIMLYRLCCLVGFAVAIFAYDYLILLSDDALWVNREYSAYPWQELLIQEFDPAGTRTHFIEQYEPTNTYLSQYGHGADPGYLFFRNKKVQQSIYL